MILFQVDSTYISKSVKKKPAQVRRREITSSVQSLKLSRFEVSNWPTAEEKSQAEARQVAVIAQDLRKSGADWNLQSSIFRREKVKQFLYCRRKYGKSLEFKFRSYATGPCLDDILLAIQKRVSWRHLDALITWGWIDFVPILEV